ncbi:MAG: alpha-amylase family glycosyl hydrolase [Inhella sp.]|uniref:alpha-amylase family glycosyl hydrolase n=1 Tax=Inhella sp. TaxID=1921806 RepID=UPI0022BC8735|nr:alpha-amylase family glycosyl hydrolase [Inhella sp.]MCZ8234510.1 alpha-amylase family glycosyl hydrolase [Inhella sp.]
MKLILSLPPLLTALAASAAPLKLHVPSPDWRDQVIYFVMTDRFADGDPRNNDQGVGAYDPRSNDRYNGGDLAGLRQRLDYIQGLGATALWLTPPVRNQWLDPTLGFTGYHGYWAQHFKEVDPHLGTLADYQRLSHDLHSRGMYLVQDIVVNHVGNYFGYEGGWDPTDPTRFYTPNTRSKPTTAPTQWPFNLNDPRRAADRQAGIYHWTPALVDVKNPDHELAHQMSGLDDLNTSNPVVMRALRDSYGFWIKRVGVDAFRVDTAFYVPPAYFEDFMHSRDAKAPGMVEVARRTGRDSFLVFGEGFGIDAPGKTVMAERIESYVRGQAGEARMNGMLNFPLYGSMVDVFARGRPTQQLADRIDAMMKVHSRPHWLPTFIDNHDVDRWLAGGSEAAMKQALLATMTLPGIPVLYYGTEQGFTEQRAAMFAKGYGSGGRDHFDTNAPLYRLTAQMTALRKANKVLSRGNPQVLAGSPSGPGAIAWRMADEKQAALVVFNTADTEVLLDNLPTGAPEGTVLRGLFSLHGPASDVTVGAQGRISLRLAPRSGLVWQQTGTVQRLAATPATPRLDPLPSTPVQGDFQVSGHTAGQADLRLVIDGDLARAVLVQVSADGRFTATVPTGRMSDPAVPHRAVLWSPGSGIASAPATFQAALPWVLLADEADPAGDDTGPTGTYVYPTHESFLPGQMDLTRTRVWSAGGSLRVELTLRNFSTVWGPANGFDHVAFTFFVELPGRSGCATAMPDQFASLPEGMRWHHRVRAHGWSNAHFGPEGASGQHDGTAQPIGAQISANPDARTVTFTLPAAALGDPATLAGARLYVTTWDYDGGYRALAAQPGPFVFGGAQPTDPRVIDATRVITLQQP